MRTVSIRLIDLQVMKINLGFVGENEHTRVLIDCKKAFDQYPGAVPSLTVKPPQGDPYPAVVSRDGDIVSWNVTNSDLVYDGEGEIQLSFTQDNVVMKTYKGRTTIDKSILPSGEAPTPIQNWLDNANVALAEIPITITTALQEAKDSGEFDGFSPTVNIENIDGGHSVTITSVEGSNTFDVMDGLRGPQGDKGEDGLSPVVSVVTVADGHVVNITDKAGLHTFEVLDGRDGAPGQDGNDGVSPAVTVQDIDNGHRLIITDATGPHTFDVINGTTVVNKIARAPKSYSVASVTFNEGAGGAVINDDFCVHMVAYNANGSAYYPNDLTDKSFSTCNILHEYGDPDSPSSDTYSINFPAAAGDVYSATIYPQKGKLYVTGVMLTLNTANMDYEIDDTSEYATPGWQNSGAKALIGETYTTIPISNIGYGCVANTWGDNDLITLPRQVFLMTGQELINRAIDVQIILPLAEPIEYDFTPLEIATKQGYNRIAVSKNGSYYESIDVDFSLTYVADLGLFKFEDYAAKTDTVLDTTLSINRSEYAKIGEHSVAIGQHPEASGDNSLALGCYTVAAGENSVALGYYSRAMEFSSFAGGSQTSANGRFSFAYGYGATANGEDSAAFGNYSRAIASRAFAAGSSSVAAGESSFALGYGAITRGSGSFASGCSFANAQYSTALGRYSTANGYGSVVAGANAETYGDTAFAIGDRTIAAGQSSLVLGKQNVIDGAYNYEEWEPNRQYYVGDLVKVTTTTEVDGVEVPHISGYKCIIDVSQAQFREYEYTYNQETGRHEERTYWEPADYGQYVMIVGNGSGNYYDEDAGEWVYNRSNAFSIGWDGNVYIAGNLYAGCDADGSGGSPVVKLSDIWVGAPNSVGQYSLAIGMGTQALGNGSFAGGAGTVASGNSSFAFGGGSRATGENSFAFGGGAFATGEDSFAIGGGTNAYGNYSIAGGAGSKSYGNGSVAIGNAVQAYGDSAFVVGQENFIDQRQADEWAPDTHYDVDDIVKVATNNSFYSCVFAHTSPEEFSVQDDQHTLWEHIDGSNLGYLFAVGNGTDNNNRSNALSVDKYGNGYFKGDVFVNCSYDGTDGFKLARVNNPVFQGSISMGTSPGRTIGYNSVAIGDYSEAMSPHTLALGYFAKARGSSAVAIGNGARSGSQAGDQTFNTIAIGTDAYALRNNSVAIGQESKANGYQSLAAGYKSATQASNTVSIGYGTVAGADDSTALGAYNVSDGFESFSEWEPNHEYHVGDYVKRTAPDGTVSGYECKTDNNLAEFMTSQQISGEWVTYWLSLTRNNYVLIVGNGNREYYWGDYIDHRSNALAIGWDGSGHFGGNLYVNCNSDSTGGELVLTSSMKGSANGIAELDANGHILTSQLPSYVDDVVNGYLYNGVFYEDQQHQHAITAESNKIYVDLHTELTYRWSGVDYVEISPSIALGTTSSTAFRGDLGQIAYSHATDASRSTTAHVSGLYKIATTAEGHVASVAAVTKSDITALGIPGEQPDISVKVDKVAMDNAGITSRTYVPLFGGAFEVTTAIRANKTVPYGRAGVSGRAHKESKHRVTINGTQYILPCQLCFTNSGLYEYIGNIDLADDYVGAEVTLNEKFDVPFFILFDDSDGQHQNIDLWTETAGTYTVLIERIDIEKNKIPNALIYDVEYSPLQIKNVPGTGSDPISIGVNGMTKGDLATIGGNIAIGFGNIASGMSNYLIGNTNYAEGGINSALGMGNAVLNGTEMLQGSAVIGTGNVVMSPFSYAFGRSNSIARSGKFNIALGTFNNMYDGAEGSAVLGGYNNVAGAAYSNFTLGNNLENHSACSTVMGVSNFIDNTDFPRWVANTSYSVGDKVFNNKIGYQCSTANSDATFDESKWIAIMHSSQRALVVGNGGSSARSNAFALDWNGDIHIMGKVYTDSNYDSTGGSRLISVSEIATVSETQAIINEYGVVS